jgi:Nif-specific regulatory protein
MLMSYHWPGNVRELENTLERAVLMCDAQVIHGHHLPPSPRPPRRPGRSRASRSATPWSDSRRIDPGRAQDHSRHSRAARLLDTTERVLNYKVRATPRRPPLHGAAGC